jgi:hypothetical protein
VTGRPGAREVPWSHWRSRRLTRQAGPAGPLPPTAVYRAWLVHDKAGGRGAGGRGQGDGGGQREGGRWRGIQAEILSFCSSKLRAAKKSMTLSKASFVGASYGLKVMALPFDFKYFPLGPDPGFGDFVCLPPAPRSLPPLNYHGNVLRSRYVHIHQGSPALSFV